jgi:hypothetical protein
MNLRPDGATAILSVLDLPDAPAAVGSSGQSASRALAWRVVGSRSLISEASSILVGCFANSAHCYRRGLY